MQCKCISDRCYIKRALSLESTYRKTGVVKGDRLKAFTQAFSKTNAFSWKSMPPLRAYKYGSERLLLRF